MRIKVWRPQEEPDPVTYVRSSETPSGQPGLVGCDIGGNQLNGGDIVFITAKGCLRRLPNCKVPGIQTDDEGRILLDN